MAFPFSHALPALGAPETENLDFKCDVDKSTAFELAKDVAAFANSSGGTILVGVCGGSTAKHFEALTAEAATNLARRYEEAIRDRCAPPPQIAHEQIAHDGGVVLAVHVQPHPLTVAVRVRGDKTDGYGADAWVFFSRVASQNKDFRPEVLPMLTPEIRRIAVLIRSIPTEAHVNITLRTQGGREDRPRAQIVEMSEAQNFVTFSYATSSGKAMRTIPLDHVLTVFRRSDGIWSMDVEHFFAINI